MPRYIRKIVESGVKHPNLYNLLTGEKITAQVKCCFTFILGFWAMFIIEDPTVTEIQNSNTSAVPLF